MFFCALWTQVTLLLSSIPPGWLLNMEKKFRCTWILLRMTWLTSCCHRFFFHSYVFSLGIFHEFCFLCICCFSFQLNCFAVHQEKKVNMLCYTCTSGGPAGRQEIWGQLNLNSNAIMIMIGRGCEWKFTHSHMVMYSAVAGEGAQICLRGSTRMKSWSGYTNRPLHHHNWIHVYIPQFARIALIIRYSRCTRRTAHE